MLFFFAKAKTSVIKLNHDLKVVAILYRIINSKKTINKNLKSLNPKKFSKKNQRELEEDLRDLKFFKLRAKEPTINLEEVKKLLLPIIKP